MLRRESAVLVVLCLCLSSVVMPRTAGAGPLAMSPSIQFGTLPWSGSGAEWELAQPLEGEVVSLDSADDRFEIRPSPLDARDWVVFVARRIGPASAVLRIRDPGGRVRAVSLAGEVVPETAFGGLLLRGGAPGTAIERFLRTGHEPVGQLAIAGARLAESRPVVAGWTKLSVDLARGVGESGGTLEVGGGTIPLHVSLLESITVQGSALLPQGFEAIRLRALDERLQNGGVGARVGVLGRFREAWWMSVFDAVPDGSTTTFVPAGFFELGASSAPGDLAYLRRLHHLGGEASGERFLALMPGRAVVANPLSGLLTRYEDASLQRIGAARTSRLDRNRVFAITGNGGGEWFLSTLQASRANGVVGLTHVRYTPSLQAFLGGRNLLIGDLSSIRYPRRGGGIRENLLVSVGTEAGDLRIIELLRDGSTVGAQVRHAMQVADPLQLPAVQKDVLPSKRAGSGGLPIRVRVVVPEQEVRLLRVDGPGSWSVLGSELFPVQLRGTGVAIGTPRFLLAGPNGQGSDLVRYAWDGKFLQARALGTSPASPIDYRASARRRHAWLLGRDDGTGRGMIQSLTNGLPTGINLPPIVVARADVRTTTPRVVLRADLLDANDDPLAVHWSAPGVEFTDQFARRTTAIVPEGLSRIRVLARERFAGTSYAAGGVALEDRDVVLVRYEATTDVDVGAPDGLATALGRPEPNPATSRTWVPFTLAAAGHARVEVFDLNGRRLRTLVDERLPAGAHDAVWDGVDTNGTRVSVGVYFVRLTVGAHDSQRRIVFVR